MRVRINTVLSNLVTDKQYKLKSYAVYTNQIIKYRDNDMYVEIKMDSNKIIMTRQNKEVKYEFEFSYKNPICTCYLLKERKTLKLNMLVQFLKIKEENFEVKYQLEDQKFYFSFLMEKELR